MGTKYNTVWIVDGHKSFAVFSSKEYAEEYRLSLIELWHKSIIKDSIPPTLSGSNEIWNHSTEYNEVIEVGDDHYERVSKSVSGPEGHKAWMYYEVMSNKEWKKYYEEYISEFVIKEWTVIK
jgi:hypothetical protein